MTVGPASAFLEQELAGEISKQKMVVWLERDAAFAGFVANSFLDFKGAACLLHM